MELNVDGNMEFIDSGYSSSGDEDENVQRYQNENYVENSEDLVLMFKKMMKTKKEKDNIIEEVCKVTLTKGKRKGFACNRKLAVEGETVCKFHAGKPVSLELCTIILTKGERKNQTCNRKSLENDVLCKIHKTMEMKRPYNPYVDKERPIFLHDNILISQLCSLEVSRVTHDMIDFIKSL